jgi:hypothetical protein
MVTIHKPISASLLFITLLSAVAAAYPAAAAGPRAPGLAVIKRGEPVFADILKVYLEEEQLGSEHLRDWERKIRKAPLLPTLYVGFDHSNRRSESLSVTDNISISGGTVTVGPEDNDLDLDNDQGQVIRVRAVWKLDEVVFNSQLFNLARERRELATLKLITAEKIHKIYESRYVALMRYLKSPSEEAYLKYEILTDRLSQLTGRRFEKKFWRRS